MRLHITKGLAWTGLILLAIGARGILAQPAKGARQIGLRAQVEDANRRWGEALRHSDAAAIAEIFTEDGANFNSVGICTGC